MPGIESHSPRPSLWLALLALLLVAAPGFAIEIDIPYDKFVLDNGLTLLVHEDHKAPIVALNIWYHVGSKNEKVGKTGFAHLFEHLMFNGSENNDDDYFQVMERIGATDLNGTTNNDRTNYFQNVPTSALDVVLWMESDRMGHLLGAITQEKLDEQRGVVENEKRQSENQPYAVSRQLITSRTYPAGHPYSWSVIGSMDDLGAASLEDVHEWFNGYYGAANAVVVLAGDIDSATALGKVKSYFGDIPSGPAVARPETWIAKRSAEIRESVEDEVPLARIYKVWNVPQWGSRDHDLLEVASEVLSSGKSSRLYKRLVYDDQIASSVAAFVDSREIGSQFQVRATAQSGADLASIERALDEEVDRLLNEGPSAEELERAKMSILSGFLRGAERIGGFGGKSDILARYQVYTGDADGYKTTLRHLEEATAEDVQQAARRWLSDGVYVLSVLPRPQYQVAESGVDRSSVPPAGDSPAVKFAAVSRFELGNGLKVLLAERHATPLVEFDLLVDAGYASDQFAAAGTARLAMDMLDEGTTTRSALEISDALDLLGAELGSGSNLDLSSVSISTLKANLDDSLAIYADVILNPSFPAEEFERRRKQQLAAIEQEKTRPVSMALRTFPGLLYGADHAYGRSLTGSGTRETVEALNRDDLVAFHSTWFRPDHATLVIVGDTTEAELRPRLEKLFNSWRAGDVPTKNVGAVPGKERPEVYLINKPGAQQSVIFAGNLAPARTADNDVASEVMNEILGGTFTARINMNLREDKHWSYGAFSFLVDTAGQRPFIVFAAVQTDKTKESMAEIQKELDGILGDHPPTSDELAKIKEAKVNQLPGSWETNGEVGGSIQEMVRYHLPSDYFDRYPEIVRSLSLDRVTQAAHDVVQAESLVWVVVGDREKIEAAIAELGLGEIGFLDADGNPID